LGKLKKPLDTTEGWGDRGGAGGKEREGTGRRKERKNIPVVGKNS